MPIDKSIVRETIGHLSYPIVPIRAQLSEWNSPELAKKFNRNAIAILISNVPGLSSDGALKEALRVAKDYFSIAWITFDRSITANFQDEIFYRNCADSTVGIGQQKVPVGFGVLRLSEIERCNQMIHSIEELRSNLKQTMIWNRILDGLSLLRSSLNATEEYERYAFLWMSIEALLGNLEFEYPNYTKESPAESRIAYRIALILPPSKNMMGLKYKDSRWARVLELRGLYSIRNKTVHEGLQSPAVNDQLFKRYSTCIIQAFWTIFVNAKKYNIQSIEEFLAYLENTYPDNSVIT